MASTGGTVSLRVALVGSEEVKTSLASLGPAGAGALKQIEQAQAGPNAGMRALDTARKDLEGGLEELGGKAGTAGHVLAAIGPAGFAAAAGIGAAVEAGKFLVDATRGAMEFGEQLLASSKAAGVSTTTLQTYRYMMQQAGGTIEQADTSLRSFTTAYGLAGEGQKRYLQFFEKLGFTKEQLKSFGSVDEALDATVDKIAGLGNAADRAAFAKRLGLADALPLIQSGTDKIAAMRAEAQSLGVVMDQNVVESLAKAEEKFKSASQVIDVQFKSALVTIAPLLVEMIGYIAQAARALNDFMAQFQKVEDRGTQALQDRKQSAEAGVRHEIESFGLDTMLRGRGFPAGAPLRQTINLRADNSEILQDGFELDKRAADDKPTKPMPPPLGGFQGPAKKTGPKGPTPDEIAKNSATTIDQGQADILNARKAELTAQLALTSDVTARAALQSQLADLEDQSAANARAKTAAEKLLLLQQGKITQSAYDQFVAEEATAKIDQDKAAAAKKELDQRNLDVALMKQAAALDAAEYQSKLTGLQAQLALATNAADRRTLALQIFDLEQQEKVAQLQATLAEQKRAGDLTDAALTQIQLNTALANAPAQRLAVSNANPVNDWAKMIVQMKADVPRLNDEFADMAAGGVAQFNASLFDSQGRLNSLGSIASSVFSKMLVDLEQYLLKQAEIGLFGGSGGFFGGLFGGGSSAAGGGVDVTQGFDLSSLGGFADGGLIGGSGGPRSDNQLAYVSPGEVIINAASARPWLPFLLAINDNRRVPIPHFADGGVVGGGGTNGVRFAGGDTHFHIDRSIHAPGADAAALRRVEAKQDEILKGEPERFMHYTTTAKKLGVYR